MAAPRIWIVTGCSSGLGKDISLEILKRGDKVISTSRDSTRLGELKAAGADTIDLDVAAPLTEIKRVIDAAVAPHGRQLDVLVNNAAFVQHGALEEISPDDDMAAFTTNVFGPMNMMRACLPYMRAQRSGTIINIGSMVSWMGGGSMTAYNATKFALSGVSECVRLETEHLGIRVVSVEPGMFRTELLGRGNYLPVKKFMPEYELSSKTQHDWLMAAHGKQLGNPKKGAKVIVDIPGMPGKVPGRLLLGSDCRKTVDGYLRGVLQELEEWKSVSDSTDFSDEDN